MERYRSLRGAKLESYKVTKEGAASIVAIDGIQTLRRGFLSGTAQGTSTCTRLTLMCATCEVEDNAKSLNWRRGCL